MNEFHKADGSVERQQHLAPDTLAVDAYRCDEVPGTHTIVYDSPADSIRITHEAHSREGFALGAVMAAEYTAKHTGLLTMKDLFDF